MGKVATSSDILMVIFRLPCCLGSVTETCHGTFPGQRSLWFALVHLWAHPTPHKKEGRDIQDGWDQEGGWHTILRFHVPH